MSRIPDLLAAGPTVSLEYFPPVLGPARLGALRAVVRLAGRRPDFVSVTEGAGGSDRGRTRQIVVDVDSTSPSMACSRPSATAGWSG